MYKSILLCVLLGTSFIAPAQDISSLADDMLGEQTEYALGTFYTSRIINGHSVFMLPKKGLDFRIHHRFGQFNTGFNKFYGIDQSSSFLSLDYGINNNINLGFGRANNAIFNGYAKVSILKQSSGAVNMPVSLVYTGICALNSYIYDDKVRNEDFNARLSYTNQLLIARMFTAKLSLQLAPTFIHRNLVPKGDFQNNTYACGIGGRYKLTNTFSVNAEWFHIFNPDVDEELGKMQDPIAFGIDIQVASHVFQVHITNAERMIENNFLTQTSGNFFKGDIRLGFNISQVFTF